MQIILFLILASIVIWVVGSILLYTVAIIVQCILWIFRYIKNIAIGIWNYFTSSRGVRFIVIIICLTSIYSVGIIQSIPILIIGTFIIWQTFHLPVKREKQYLSWLKNQGIGKLSEAPVKSKIYKKYQDKVYILGEDYVIYVPLYDELVEKITAKRVVNLEEIKNICLCPNLLLTDSKLEILIKYLKRKQMLLEITSPNTEHCYLTPSTISDCIALFDEEGAATVTEFAEICQNSKEIGNLDLDYQTLAQNILNMTVYLNKSKIVEMPGEILYIAKDTFSSKTKQVEIAL